MKKKTIENLNEYEIDCGKIWEFERELFFAKKLDSEFAESILDSLEYVIKRSSIPVFGATKGKNGEIKDAKFEKEYNNYSENYTRYIELRRATKTKYHTITEGKIVDTTP